ncbi:BTAD domain-containing putative transcriptional regulator [Mycolicibacterium pulveris]|uniref:BTAD domain-containing putative transcriptional regulator n=1 Tax=Mycolicibacterium pulveris TaxID=36813 RepID=UPI003CF2D919
MELGVLGPLQVRQYGLPVTIPGAKPRAILTMLGLHGGTVVSADALLELLWGDDPPRTAAKALQTHVSSLRRALGDGFIVTQGTGWTVCTAEIDATRYKSATSKGRDAIAAGDAGQAVAHFDKALALWRGVPELPDGTRGSSEKTRWLEAHASLVEDRADAVLATGRAAEIIGELEAAVAEAPLRERRWGQLMLALYRAGRQGEALGAFQRARSLLVDELGVEPGPDLRRLETAIVAQDSALDVPVSQRLSVVTRAVTFLLTDIEGSTAAWEADAEAMAVALARHDEIVEQVVTSRGGRLIKTRGEGDATFSVFDRPSAAAMAAIELQEAIRHEPWKLAQPMRIRIALHTGEVGLRDGDYFGRAVNRAARLRSLATGGQILCSGATAELVIDSLPEDVVLADLGTRQLRNLARPEHVFELRLLAADESRDASTEEPLERPALPGVLAGPGPFVGRGDELGRLLGAWQTTLAAGTRAVLIAGEPGVGKTRLAGEWSRQAYEQGAAVLYGRCDEDLGAHYQPFAEALRSLVPHVGANRLRGLRGVESLLPLVPRLSDVLPDLSAPHHADPDTERYALFDAVVALLEIVSADTPVVLVLDDLHWAAKPTLLLMRHLLRFGERARVQIVGTYRSTDLDRSHPLAAMLADLHRDGSADRIALGGLDEDEVSAYVVEAGYDDGELARALASVTGGNPFFLIEALRHVDESGGHWDPNTLPQGVREAVSRRLSRLPAETNKALAAAAVVGSRFAIDLVERVMDQDLVDAFDEACKAGIVLEEQGGRYRFNHALVRQALLAELPSVRRMRLHQHIAATLEAEPGADEDLLGELAYHYFECAWAGNAAKAVHYCRRAADQAMARLAYEGAADHYDRALHALDELDDELPDRDQVQAELLIARCEALLAAGDVVSAKGAVSQLLDAAGDSARLAAWGTCFDGQLSMLTDPERLDDIESAVEAAAVTLAGLDDAAGVANAHTVRAGCLARLGRIADCERALDQALTAARRAQEHRRVNAVLAGAPLAALWGPNPVPRAGGRCLDVVRLLRITTGSPVVEATSTRCQGVLDAFRGRAAAGRHLIESARRTLTELGMRHALLEVDQFAGIVELVANEPAAAEPYLRRAYDGFRRMRLDADTAESAAQLARACLALGRESEADELCTESEHLAGHALKASIAWRTVRAQLLARSGAHDEARRVAEEAVALAGRTDALVDHGDACLALATVLSISGDTVAARAAAERAVGLYDLKGAVALADKTRRILGGRDLPIAESPPQAPPAELDNACVQALRRLDIAFDRKAWDELENQVAPWVTVESRRNVIGMTREALPSDEWVRGAMAYPAIGALRHSHVVLAVRGERLALTRLAIGTEDDSVGAPRDELLQLYGLDENGRIALQVWFDTDDLDAAIVELDALHAQFEGPRSLPRFENAAIRADDRLIELFGDNRLDEIEALFSEDTRVDDRRQGLRRESDDRASAVANIRAIAASGAAVTKTTVAVRGDLLCLSHIRFQEPTGFSVQALEITEVDAGGLIAAKVLFDVDDIDSALAELNARYAAAEAAPYAETWSVVTRAYEALNRHELPATTPGWANVDRRRIATIQPGDMTTYLHDSWAAMPDARMYITRVHRLTEIGAVLTHAAYGTTTEGFGAEWQDITVLTVEDGLINRCELFDAGDLDAAVARFDELSRSVPRLENTAIRVGDRLLAAFAARDWVAMADKVADNFHGIDRRRVVNAGLHGRDAFVESLRATVELGGPQATSEPVAIRAERLVLTRVRYVLDDDDPDAFRVDFLQVVEIDAEERIATVVTFDPDDIDAAFEELDRRYLAGEAAAHAETWSLVVGAYAGFNHRDLTATTPDFDSVDHRRGAAFAPGDMIAYIQAAWRDSPDTRIYIAAVHRLSDFGAVVTHIAQGLSLEGFDAEWRDIHLLTVDGDTLSRCELFNEEDLDVALARFDELGRTTPARLQNRATHVWETCLACFRVRDWRAMAKTMRDDFYTDDRRRTVNAGLRRGRDGQLEDVQASVDVVGITNATCDVIATRGANLALTRVRYSAGEQPVEATHYDVLSVVEIDANESIAAVVVFDEDDIDAAFVELDTRYVAGEAASYSHTWSVLATAYASIRRHELPSAMLGCVNVDHRRTAAFAPGELREFIRTGAELNQVFGPHMEVVHRLTFRGAVITYTARSTSPEGFEAEWREVSLSIVDGDSITRCELFDEADLDSALARFDELSHSAPLENSVTRVIERFGERFAARDWDAVAATLSDDFNSDDRRRTVNAGIRHGRAAEIDELRVAADVGFTSVTSGIVATRGQHLALTRARVSGPDSATFHTDVLHVVEGGDDDKLAAVVVYDGDDFDAAIAELDARYAAGEAAEYARTWSVIARSVTAVNSHRLPDVTPDWVSIDHRRGAIAFAPGGLQTYTRTLLDDSPEFRVHITAVHRLNGRGAVVAYVARATSTGGFEAEWREIAMSTVHGERVNRTELFEEADLDAALARFDELERTRRLENAASRAHHRFITAYTQCDWDTLADTMADDFFADDRRSLVGTGVQESLDSVIAQARVTADLGITNSMTAVVATRGERLALVRARFWGDDARADAFHAEVLHRVEIDAQHRITNIVAFDLTDFDAAVVELDARYLGGEAAPHAHTWSVIADACAAFNRHELPPTTPDWVSLDHRRTTPIAPGELFAYVRAAWEVAPDISNHIEVVHRLTDQGAVLTRAATGTSQAGINAEWRVICLVMFDGELLSRVELFDENALDTALARFDDLSRTASLLDNAATQSRFLVADALNRRDFDGVVALSTADGYYEDRRKGLRHEARGAEVRRVAYGLDPVPTGWVLAVTPLATRGSRVALTRDVFRDTTDPDRPITAEHLTLTEVGDDGLVCRSVLFDVDDVDAAFDELEKRYAAGKAGTLIGVGAAELAEHFREAFAARDWDAVRDTFAEDFCLDDRRRTVNAGIRYGRDAEIEDLRVAADVGFTDMATSVIAARGQNLILVRVQWSAQGHLSEAFHSEWLGVIEIDPDDRIASLAMFELDDIDAAVGELDTRFVTGEAADYSSTWSRIADVYAALNRHELPRTTPDWINLDHRSVTAFAPGELAPYIRAGWDQGEEFRVDVLAVHRLTSLGAVVTTVARGRSQTGFDAEWRETVVLMFDGSRLNRVEIFDETDVAAACARFDDLNAPA